MQKISMCERSEIKESLLRKPLQFHCKIESEDWLKKLDKLTINSIRKIIFQQRRGKEIRDHES